MKSTLKFGLAISIIASSILSSCGKYEEGPKLSLASKKGRVANTWMIEKFYEDGVDKTSDYRTFAASESFEYKKDGTYTQSQTATSLFGGGTDTDSGTWEFINDNEDIKTLSSEAGSTPDTMRILRLKSNEMWVKSVSGTPVAEIHFISK